MLPVQILSKLQKVASWIWGSMPSRAVEKLKLKIWDAHLTLTSCNRSIVPAEQLYDSSPAGEDPTKRHARHCLYFLQGSRHVLTKKVHFDQPQESNANAFWYNSNIHHLLALRVCHYWPLCDTGRTLLLFCCLSGAILLTVFSAMFCTCCLLTIPEKCKQLKSLTLP